METLGRTGRDEDGEGRDDEEKMPSRGLPPAGKLLISAIMGAVSRVKLTWQIHGAGFYSHSMVAGGFDDTS
jgi:hypothetical protein